MKLTHRRKVIIPRRNVITMQIIDTILQMYKDGHSFRDIQERLQLAKTTAWRVVNKYSKNSKPITCKPQNHSYRESLLRRFIFCVHCGDIKR